jgi:alpha-ketoglutarate-dependent taurine dioxygenase
MSDPALSRRKITASDLKSLAGLPILLEVETSALNVVRWVEEHQDDVRALLETRGALLIRGLKLLGSAQFGKLLSSLFGSELLEYVYRSTPRTQVRGNVYTATEYPADQAIPQHNENSYSRTWPNRLGFMCLTPAETGGETPISDSRVVYGSLPESIRARFEEKGVMYIRNYSNIDLPWPVVFQTEDRSEVEAFCEANELTYEWMGDDRLRTIQVNPATAVHPRTGEKVWFNQAHLFHTSSLGKEIADTLLNSLGEENLPRNAYYGDGSRIEPEALELIRATYEQTKVKFAWQKNDLLLLDNMLFAHGRESYAGARKVLVGMTSPNR